MRGLKICLWITALACLLTVFGLFTPVSTWESFTKLFGVESLPDSPVFVYAARLMSATYVGIGVFFVMLALRPESYGVLVPFSGLAALLLGVVCMVTGLMVGMPVVWFLGDSLPCIVLGALILLFWKQAKRAAG